MDSLNTGANTPENTAAPEGHDEAMVAKVDEVEAKITEQQAPTEEAPEKILGKFDNVEALTAAYQELERKQSQGTEEEAAPEAETPEGETEQGDAEKLVADAGLVFTDLEAKYAETQTLDEGDYAKLEEAGISKDMVDKYIEGQVASATLYQNEVFDSVGGEENFEAMSQWAGANMTVEDLNKYNADIDSGDKATVKNAVDLVNMKYQAAMGTTPNLINGDTGGGTGSVFESVAQLTAAMKDPRYSTDSAYRAEVAAKLDKSNIL